jgi:DNA mismatch repair protein MutS2
MRLEAQRERLAAEEARQKLEERLEGIEDEKAALLEQTRQELQTRADEVQRRLREAERAMAKAGQGTGQDLKEERRDLTSLRKELISSSWQSPRLDRQWVQSLKQGDSVYVRGIPHPVEVLNAPGEDGVVEVALGAMRARILLDSVQRKSDVPASSRPAPPRPSPVSRPRAGADLDLRGMRVEAALDRVDLFLDKALRDGLTSVRIIHGAGTGALRAALREYLSSHRLAKSSQPEPTRSTDGATMVELV